MAFVGAFPLPTYGRVPLASCLFCRRDEIDPLLVGHQGAPYGMLEHRPRPGLVLRLHLRMAQESSSEGPGTDFLLNEINRVVALQVYQQSTVGPVPAQGKLVHCWNGLAREELLGTRVIDSFPEVYP